MWNIQIENHVKKENKMEENTKKAYAMIFKEFCPSWMQKRFKYHHEYNSLLNETLKVMDALAQEMHKPIQATYAYLSLGEPLARKMSTRQQGKEGFVDYVYRFKQERSIMKSVIGSKQLNSLLETTKVIKKLDELDDAEEINKMKKSAFKA